MEDRCNAMLDHTVTKPAALAVGMLRRAGKAPILAIDEHKIPRYDKNPDMKYLKNSKYEKGTFTFEVYTTCKLVVKKGVAVHLAGNSTFRGDEQPDLVRKLLQKCIDQGVLPYIGGKRSTVLVDRGFYSAEVMSTIDDMGFAFIMPAVKNDGKKAAIAQYVQGQWPTVSLYKIKSADGKRFTFRLIIKKNPKKSDSDNIFDWYHVFATTLRCSSYAKLLEYVPNEYRNRWDIETGYRCAKSVRLRTCSKNPIIRLALFYISLAICNIWMAIRNLPDPKAQGIMLQVRIPSGPKHFDQYAGTTTPH